MPIQLDSRRLRLVALLLLLLAAGLSVAWTRVPQTEGRTVLGDVVNGTPGEAVPDDLTVTLHIFSEMDETGTYTSTVSEDGSFGFENVPFQEGDTLVARALYDGVTYVSEFVTVEQEQQNVSLPLTVYETTDDDANVAIVQLHLFANQIGERIQIGAYAVLGNTGSRTYVGTERPSSDEDEAATWITWSARLPDAAENLQFDNGELAGRFVALEDGFADTRPIPPGNAGVETSFTYELPFQEGVEIEQTFDLPVRATVLVLPEGDWALEGPGISSEGTLDTQMGAALSYSAGPLNPGEPLAFTIVPRAAADTGTSDSQDAHSPLAHFLAQHSLAVGIVALIVAGVTVTRMWRAPSPGPIPAGVRNQVEGIAALDRDYERGKLSEASYRDKRRSLKRDVRETLSDTHP